MRVWLKLIVCIFIYFFIQASYAIINLELTQGISAGIPIAVLPFVNEQQNPAPGNQAVSTIVRNDLQNSGEFKIKPNITDVSPANATQINAGNWRKQGVDDVV